jgi:anti-sigma factor RsiW
MTSECEINQPRIPRSFVGDLSTEDQRALEAHLACCTLCREESVHYAETIGMLHSTVDEPIPHHFFIYPKEKSAHPWELFRQMMPRWQFAISCAAGLLLFIAVATFSGIEVRGDGKSWAVSFGRGYPAATLDSSALKAEILKVADERNRELAAAYFGALRSELAATRSDLTQQQQVRMISALNALETSFNQRMEANGEDLRAGSRKSSVDLFQAISLQREQDMNAVNARIDKVIDDSEVKARQTDTILETLLQVANLNLKQPGEQK